jgi:hypothetical protein
MAAKDYKGCDSMENGRTAYLDPDTYPDVVVREEPDEEKDPDEEEDEEGEKDDNDDEEEEGYSE